MYEYQGLSDAFFLMLYGAAAWFALLASVYLLFGRGNAVASDEVVPSTLLRRWTAAFMLAFILFVHVAYSTNAGALPTEYLSQVNTLIIIAFLVWRVESLQELESGE